MKNTAWGWAVFFIVYSIQGNHMKNSHKKNMKLPFMIIGIILVIIAVMLFVIFLLKGKTDITGQWNSATSSASVSCSASDLDYPIFEYDNSNRKTINVKATFNENHIQSVSLAYDMSYDNQETVAVSEARNQAAMNISFSDNGLKASDYAMTFSNSNNKLIMTLYTNFENLNAVANKYFLLTSAGKNASIDELTSNYEKQGFECKQNINNSNKEDNE